MAGRPRGGTPGRLRVRRNGTHGPAHRMVGLVLAALLVSACSTGALAAGNLPTGPAAPGRPATSGPATSGPTESAEPAESPSSTAPAPAGPTAPTGQTEATSAATTDGRSLPRRVSELPLPDGLAPEASGIARSSSDPNVFFLVDDANGAAALDAVRITADGARPAGRWLIDQVTVGNPEALASGPCGPGGPADRTCLYIGDIGEAGRDTVAVLRLVEPDLPADPGATAVEPIVIAAEGLSRFTYPDTAPDAESMMIDQDGSVLIASKPARPPVGEPADPVRLFRGAPDGGGLTQLAEFRLPAPQHPLQSRIVGVQLTDMALDGDRVLLLTYDQVLEYRRPDPTTPVVDFPSWPVQELTFPNLPQAEGITGLGDGCGFVVASEAGPGGSTGSLATVTC